MEQKTGHPLVIAQPVSRTLERGEATNSEQVQEILEGTPNWAIRGGSFICLLIIAMFVLGSILITYPEKLPAEIILTTTSPPISVVANSQGALEEIFISNNDQVQKGQVLATIYNAASLEDVHRLSEHLGGKLGLQEIAPQNLSLGDLSSIALEYFDSRRKLDLFLLLNEAERQKAVLNKQIINYEQLLEQQINQFNLAKRETSLSELEYKRNESLYRAKVLSDQEIQFKERELITVKKNLSIVAQGISSTKAQIGGLAMALNELEMTTTEERSKLEQFISVTSEKLQSSILLWEEKYLLRSKISGKITFSDNWAEGRNVELGQTLFRVDPIASNVVGKLKLPLAKSGKIKEGQIVQIKLENYPFEEFGMLLGKVKSMNSLPNDKFYLIDVELPDGLLTTFNRKLEFHQEMIGQANILLDSSSLFERLVYQLRRAYNQN